MLFVGKHEKGAVDRYTYVASFFLKPPKLAKKQLEHSCKYQDIVVGIISIVLKTNKNSSLWNKLDMFIQIKSYFCLLTKIHPLKTLEIIRYE